MKSLKKPVQFIILALFVICFFVRCGEPASTGESPAIAYNADSAKQHIITIKAARALTAGFRSEKANMAKQLRDPAYLSKSFGLPLAEKFNRDAIALLLNQKGAKGIRIYLGKDTDGLVKMVLVAVDDKGNDLIGGTKKIINQKGSASIMDIQDDGSGDDGGIALEAGQRCPTLCSTNGL